MNCQRCQGWMVEERIFTQQGGISMSRCVYCGELVDSVVMANRKRSQIAYARAGADINDAPGFSLWRGRGRSLSAAPFGETRRFHAA